MIDLPSSNLDPDLARVLAQEAARRTRAAATRSVGKEILCRALEEAGITDVTVTFDGSGDSGQIETIDAFAGDRMVTLPEGTLTLDRSHSDGSGLHARSYAIAEAVEALAYDCLEAVASGWENNDGASGEIRFAVAARTITLELNTRVMDTEYAEHVF